MARVRQPAGAGRVERRRGGGDRGRPGRSRDERDGRRASRVGDGRGAGPRGLVRDARRGGPPALEDRADRERELHVRRGHGGPGVLAHEQVRGGPAGPALLRWLRVRRRRGAARPGSRNRPLPGLGARQRPAPCGRPGKPGRVLRGPLAGRPDPRDEPGPRRASHARLAGERQRQVVRGPRLRRRPGDEPDRLRRGGAAGGGGPAEARHRRGQLLFAHPRLRALRGDRPRRGGVPPRGHGAHRRARRGRAASVALPARGPGHDDDPQDTPGPPGRPHLLDREAREAGGQGGLSRAPRAAR